MKVSPELDVPESCEKFARDEGTNPYSHSAWGGDQVLRRSGKKLDARKMDPEDA